MMTTDAPDPVDLDLFLRRPLAEGLNADELGPDISRVTFGDHAKTILLYVSTDCRYCTASMGFYRMLADSEVVKSRNVQFVMVGPDAEGDLASTPVSIQSTHTKSSQHHYEARMATICRHR